MVEWIIFKQCSSAKSYAYIYIILYNNAIFSLYDPNRGYFMYYIFNIMYLHEVLYTYNTI